MQRYFILAGVEQEGKDGKYVHYDKAAEIIAKKENRIKELESAMQELVDNHKNVVTSEDPTGLIVDSYYNFLRRSKELLQKQQTTWSGKVITITV